MEALVLERSSWRWGRADPRRVPLLLAVAVVVIVAGVGPVLLLMLRHANVRAKLLVRRSPAYYIIAMYADALAVSFAKFHDTRLRAEFLFAVLSGKDILQGRFALIAPCTKRGLFRGTPPRLGTVRGSWR